MSTPLKARSDNMRKSLNFPFFSRFFRKPIVIIALMFTVMFGSYFAQSPYYSWSVGYTIKPLTQTITMSIATSGATTATDVLLGNPTINIVKDGTLHVEFLLGDLAAIRRAFHRLHFTIIIFHSTPLTTLKFDVLEGRMEVDGVITEFNPEIRIPMPPGTWQVEFWVDYETKAVTETLSESIIIINFWFVEG